MERASKRSRTSSSGAVVRGRARAYKPKYRARGAQYIAANRTRRGVRGRRNLAYAGQLGIELKFLDTAASGNVVSSSTSAGGQITPSATVMIACPIVGDGPQNRDGSRIRVKNILIRGRVTSDGYISVINNHPAGDCIVTGYLVMDTQCNGVLADSGVIFDNTTAGAASTNLSLRDMATAQRFRILKKQVWRFPNPNFAVNAANPATASYVSGFETMFEWNIDRDDLVHFDTASAGSTNTVANLTKINYIPVFFTNNSLYVPYVTYVSRVRFYG